MLCDVPLKRGEPVSVQYTTHCTAYSLGKLNGWAILSCMHKHGTRLVGFGNCERGVLSHLSPDELPEHDRSTVYSLIGGMKAISSSSERCCGGRPCSTDWLKWYSVSLAYLQGIVREGFAEGLHTHLCAWSRSAFDSFPCSSGVALIQRANFSICESA